MVDWNAVSGVVDLYLLAKDVFSSTSARHKHSLELTTLPPQEQVPYQTSLGRRHKFLRQDILHLDLREMANFYGFEKVAYLEACEAGLDEFPTVAIQQLVQIFFICPKYLQTGEAPIFQSFKFNDTKEECRYSLELGFYPYFLCGPSFEQDGHAYLTFYKEDEGYWRMIQSNTVGSFYSSGGGSQNIHNLIYPMLDLHLSPDWSHISFLNVCPEEWEKLTKGCWYNKGMRGYVGAANHESRDIFESWFEEAQKLVGFAQPKKRRQSGSAKGSIWMSPDVDQPLEDFREYMS